MVEAKVSLDCFVENSDLLTRKTVVALRRASLATAFCSGVVCSYIWQDQRAVGFTLLALSLSVFFWQTEKLQKARGRRRACEQKLRELVQQAEQQSTDLSPASFRERINEIVKSFSCYARVMDMEGAGGTRCATATEQLRVLADYLETPCVNNVCSFGWTPQWDIDCMVLSQDVYEQLALVCKTVIAAAKAQHDNEQKFGPGGILFLAHSCSRLLEHPSSVRFMVRWNQRDDAVLTEDTDSPVGSGFPVRGVASTTSNTDSWSWSRLFCPCFERGDEDSSVVQASGTSLFGRSDPTVMLVRGPNYLNDGNKVFSQSHMLELLNVHYFIPGPQPPSNYAEHPRSFVQKLREEGDNRFFFVVNLLLDPMQAAAVWAVPEGADWFDSREGQLWHKFCNEMDEYERNHRFKIIPRITQAPWIVKQAVPEIPSIVGTKLPVTWKRGDNYLEGCIDIVRTDFARKIVRHMQSASKHFTVDVYFVIEAVEQDELPERMLCGWGQNPIDMGALPPL
eukprot:TRINITY_DN34137_c0_g1_i1.p1 TRINITY_DN34137_c0_g1~~TRINITY_DN34137_c0_g1_i1.p1  ORF type:complete len:508 (+),score=93.97 TRINITY_DN34137_c0_g1_i1:180-1703(+)